MRRREEVVQKVDVLAIVLVSCSLDLLLPRISAIGMLILACFYALKKYSQLQILPHRLELLLNRLSQRELLLLRAVHNDILHDCRSDRDEAPQNRRQLSFEATICEIWQNLTFGLQFACQLVALCSDNFFDC